MKYKIASVGLLIAALTSQSCLTVGTNFQSPDVSVPDAWTASLQGDLEGSASGLEKWWLGFKDPVLNELIDRTREENPEFRIAAQRILEARAQRGIAGSALLPGVDGGGSYSRNRSSESVRDIGGGLISDLYQAGFDTGWELDVFGGLRRNLESADANVEVSIENYRDLLVTLYAETALNYVDYRTTVERIRVAQKNIASQEDSLELASSKLEAGLVSKIDKTQAATNLESSRALIPQLRSQLASSQNRLATLTGGFPASVKGMLAKSRPIPIPRSGFSAGLPAELIRARPDVRRAERELASQTARIGVAEADLYPRFSLFGNFSLQSIESSDFLNAKSGVYSFGPAFSWQIFSAGRIRNNILAEEARTEQALGAYEKAILLAVEEVETSMAAVANERDRLVFLNAAVDAAQETVQLVKDNYEQGLVDFQRVIDSERTLFQQEDAAAVSKGLISQNYIALYKALGGGSQVKVIPIAKPSVSAKGGPFGMAKTGAPTEITLED